MPGGRPSAPCYIVPQVNVLDDDAIIAEKYNITSLALIPDILKWCACHKLIKNSLICPRCGSQCGLISRADLTDKKTWYCSACKTRRSIRQGSWFEGSHLSLRNILVLSYCWAHKYSQKAMAREASCDKTRTAFDWARLHRELCEEFLEENPSQIGGISDSGDPIVVEVNESKFFHHKYHSRLWREGHWVLGGIEQGSKKCFLVIVPDRTEQTLRDVTFKWILPGSHIVSDGWETYNNIEDWAHGVYTHSAVDPQDAEVHTRKVENMWMRVKNKIRRQFGTSDELFTSYLPEFIWRQTVPEDEAFQHLLHLISTVYPV